MADSVREESQHKSLKDIKPCAASFVRPKAWYGRAKSFYLPERASLEPPHVNEELCGPRSESSQSVSFPYRLLAQMGKVCGSMANIASWMDQVLAALAGATSGVDQDTLEFLSALAKANKDILHPAEGLCCRFLMLQRQAVVASLPRTFADRERLQLLSSPFTGMLFDPAVVAMVQDKERLAAQQRMFSL